MRNIVLTIDQGTTSTRALLIAGDGQVLAMAQKEFKQFFPNQGWVEHDPHEILSTVLEVVDEVMQHSRADEVGAIGITNQRETTVMWDRSTGKAIGKAIVWQDRRTAPLCEQLKLKGLGEYIHKTTGLLIDAYFSATKMQWLKQHHPETEVLEKQNRLAFGTIDSWLIFHLTGGMRHVTDVSNASRTMLFDIHRLDWDDTLLQECGISRASLPTVLPSIGHFGEAQLNGRTIPITGVAGDQQAALFGQRCFEPGMVKNTYGTGCFMLMNIGRTARLSSQGLLTTIAWSFQNEVTYALEGAVFIAGAAVQWLRDEMHMIDSSADSEYFARKADDKEMVYVVPAFAGLGAPYWDMYARGAIFGLTRDTGKEDIIRATLESLAFQTRDVLDAMTLDAQTSIQTLLVDGGAGNNDFLMQFQSDILQRPVVRPANVEATALGAARMAAIGAGFMSWEEFTNQYVLHTTFHPTMEPEDADRRYKGWKKAVKRTMHWTDDEP